MLEKQKNYGRNTNNVFFEVRSHDTRKIEKIIFTKNYIFGICRKTAIYV